MPKRASIILLAALTLIIGVATVTQAADDNHAAVVVSLGDGAVASRCVAFSEPEISGFELLQRSGLNLIVDDQAVGSAICSIEGTGCPADDCFCECRGGGSCTYWSYWHRQDETWNYSAAGANVYRISDGMVDGWSWGPGSVTEAIPPASLSFADVCAVDTEPTPTYTPSATTAVIVIVSLAPATETPQGNSPTATIRPTETRGPASLSTEIALSPTAPSPVQATSAAPTSQPQSIGTPNAALPAPTQPQMTPLVPTAELSQETLPLEVAAQPERAATTIAYPIPEVADDSAAGPIAVIDGAGQPAGSDTSALQTQEELAAVTVIGSEVKPAVESAVAAIDPNDLPSPAEPTASWRPYAALMAMLLTLGALVAVSKLRSVNKAGRG